VADWANSRKLDYAIETVFKKWLELDRLQPKEIVKKPFYCGDPMVWSETRQKWFVITKYGEWLEYADKEEKIEDINLETKVQVKKLLTEKQLTYFNNNNYNWWDMSENCWHAGNMGMNSRKQMMMSRRSNCW